MKIPLHITPDDWYTQEGAFARLQLWHHSMSRRPIGHGFRVPVGTFSKRRKPRQGNGIKRHEGGLFAFLNGLQVTLQHGERNVTG